MRKVDAGVAKALEELQQDGPTQLAKALDEWAVDDGLVLYKGKVYVPDDNDI